MGLKSVPSLIPYTFHKEYTQEPSAELLVHWFSKLTAAVSQYMLLASLVIFSEYWETCKPYGLFENHLKHIQNIGYGFLRVSNVPNIFNVSNDFHVFHRAFTFLRSLSPMWPCILHIWLCISQIWRCISQILPRIVQIWPCISQILLCISQIWHCVSQIWLCKSQVWPCISQIWLCIL